ncbi:hypothetical protein, partial [Aneurinibacillus migulanus]|uniref:hypothetical protein n=1 Tax=Aneurinibacillus migulanus TaxID=47500 RepID=UPI000ACBE177
TNTNSTPITVEGAYDAFTITNRENPAFFTYTLASGASMEATNIGSRTSVYMTGTYDFARYDSLGQFQDYGY